MTKQIVNYLGQMRIYSFLDAIVLGTALSDDWKVVISVALLHTTYLLFLESRHHDIGRLPIGRYAWVIPFLITFLSLPWIVPIGYMAFAIPYTQKKFHWFFSLTSPVWRGCQVAWIALFLRPEIAAIAFLLMFIRNLVGDVRDIGDDKNDGMFTIPIALGGKKNQPWAFYGHFGTVLMTTLAWYHYSFLPLSYLGVIIGIQALIYPLTPRASNPAWARWYGFADKQ